MKNIIFIFTLFGLLVFSSTVMASQEKVGVIAAAKGNIIIERNGKKLKAKSGAKVYEGDNIVSKSNKQFQVIFIDETIFTLTNNSNLSIDKFAYDKESKSGELKVSTDSGKVKFSSGNISDGNPDNFVIKLPNSSEVKVRGTGGVYNIIPPAQPTGQPIVFAALNGPGPLGNAGSGTGSFSFSTPNGDVDLNRPGSAVLAAPEQPPVNFLAPPPSTQIVTTGLSSGAGNNNNNNTASGSSTGSSTNNSGGSSSSNSGGGTSAWSNFFDSNGQPIPGLYGGSPDNSIDLGNLDGGVDFDKDGYFYVPDPNSDPVVLLPPPPGDNQSPASSTNIETGVASGNGNNSGNEDGRDNENNNQNSEDGGLFTNFLIPPADEPNLFADANNNVDPADLGTDTRTFGGSLQELVAVNSGSVDGSGSYTGDITGDFDFLINFANSTFDIQSYNLNGGTLDNDSIDVQGGSAALPTDSRTELTVGNNGEDFSATVSAGCSNCSVTATFPTDNSIAATITNGADTGTTGGVDFVPVP